MKDIQDGSEAAVTERTSPGTGFPGGLLTFRRALPGDVPEIARIEAASFPDPWTIGMITEDVSGNDRTYMAVAELDGRICGYADICTVAGEAQLYNIAVDESCRGMHIGEGLLKHVTDVSIAGGCSLMTLEVRAGNHKAISLYRKAGFTETGIRPGYYEDDGEDAILMDRIFE